MTNQERITAHNALIDEAIAKANALPNAGSGGGGGETVEAVIQSLTVTENGTYDAPAGVDGYNPVTVNVPIPSGYVKPSGTKSITTNGTHDVTSYASVNVNVPTEGGGGESAGVCPTLTITHTAFDIFNIFYPSGGFYNQRVGMDYDGTITLENVDVGKAIFIHAIPMNMDYGVKNLTNIELLVDNAADEYCFAVTSTSPASVKFISTT